MTIVIETVGKTQKQIDEETRQYHRNRLVQLCKKSIELLRDVPELEEPDHYQKQWVVFRLIHSNTWPKVHENKIGDVKNWIGGDGQ